MLITYPRIESEDTRYAYAVGRIRALEAKLLSSYKIARLLEAKDGDELLRSLQDTDYSAWLPGDARDYENMLKKARIELHNLVDKLILDELFITVLKVKYDYHNAKVLLKSAIKEEEAFWLLSELGNIPKDELKSIFQEERYDKLGYNLPLAIGEAIATYYTNKDPRFLDIILDKFYYSYLAETPHNTFLNSLTKIEIDLVNIKTLLRIKWLKEEKSLLRASLVPGGWLEAFRFLESFDEPIESIPKYFNYTPYADIFNEGIEFLRTKNSFSRLEKLCDTHFTEFCRATKYLTFGIEPIIAYFYGKENEFKILRMIFVGKLNQIPEDLIKERLPEAY
ncbi:V-type ATP synthase subunit C [candidate division WOR-3 bacterium]|nr:V-type ATP synthase subunit C [candidate division WOR-3 bacterium]